tara:strand:+ start:107 stop:1831 length:1725 start_codon:yes stop_codon:yes gene_type:complete
MSLGINSVITNAMNQNKRTNIRNKIFNEEGRISGLTPAEVRKAMKNNPRLAEALSAIPKVFPEKGPDGPPVVDAVIDRANQIDSTNLVDAMRGVLEPENRGGSLPDPRNIMAEAAGQDVMRAMYGGLMSMSPQVRMQQGLMEAYRPPIRMDDGGIVGSDLLNPTMEELFAGYLGTKQAQLLKDIKTGLQNQIDVSGSYFGSDEEETQKAASNLQESIAKQQARESNPGEVLSGFERFLESVGGITNITGESVDTNIGDLEKEIKGFYTDAITEDAPRQTEKRIQNRQEIRSAIDDGNLTSDQLLSINEAIQSGKAPQDADALRSMLISGVEEDQTVDTQSNAVDTQSNAVDTQSNAVDVNAQDDDSSTNSLDAAASSLVTTGDLFEDAKKAKDPESFVDSLSSIDLLRMAAGYLGTTSVTAGTKGALTNLLKGKEADKAHDLAVKKADSIDEYYKGLLKSQSRGQDLTYSAQLAKILEDTKIDPQDFAAQLSKVRTAYIPKFGTGDKESVMTKLKTTDKSLHDWFINNNIDPDVETIIRAVASKDFGIDPTLGGISPMPSGNNSLVKSVTITSK